MLASPESVLAPGHRLPMKGSIMNLFLPPLPGPPARRGCGPPRARPRPERGSRARAAPPPPRRPAAPPPPRRPRALVASAPQGRDAARQQRRGEGRAGRLPQPLPRAVPGAPRASRPGPPLPAAAGAGSASPTSARRTCGREDDPEGHAGAPVCRGMWWYGRSYSDMPAGSCKNTTAVIFCDTLYL